MSLDSLQSAHRWSDCHLKLQLPSMGWEGGLVITLGLTSFLSPQFEILLGKEKMAYKTYLFNQFDHINHHPSVNVNDTMHA